MAYTQQAQAALRILARKGAAMTLRRVVRGALNATTNLPPSSTTTDYPVVAAIVPIGFRHAGIIGDASFEQAALIRGKAAKVLIAGLSASGVALAITPQPGDLLVAPAETLTLAGVTTIAPDGGAAVLHVCEAKR